MKMCFCQKTYMNICEEYVLVKKRTKWIALHIADNIRLCAWLVLPGNFFIASFAFKLQLFCTASSADFFKLKWKVPGILKARVKMWQERVLDWFLYPSIVLRLSTMCHPPNPTMSVRWSGARMGESSESKKRQRRLHRAGQAAC